MPKGNLLLLTWMVRNWGRTLLEKLWMSGNSTHLLLLLILQSLLTLHNSTPHFPRCLVTDVQSECWQGKKTQDHGEEHGAEGHNAEHAKFADEYDHPDGYDDRYGSIFPRPRVSYI